MTDRLALPGLYVHLPFCAKICPYCDFYVLTGESSRNRRFLRTLIQEIELSRQAPWPSFVEEIPEPRFDTLYLGGGTPSILPADDLLALREALTEILPLTERPWVGLEANPEDVTEARLVAWRNLGVQFLSLGIQSFDRRQLRFLGRGHDPADCRASLDLARASDIETLSIDLIFGLPHQTLADWRRDLETALEHRPDHVSCYQLTIEPGTPFGFRRQQGRLEELPADKQADQFYLTHRLLADHGYAAYEVSNFASHPRHRSLHNAKYWCRAPYLGLGPSAHSFASNQRWWNVRKIKPYEASVEQGRRPIDGIETLSPEQVQLEVLMLGLRTPSGIDFSAFPDGSGARIWQANLDLIEELVENRLVRVVGQGLVPTLSGLAVSEAIARRFRLANLESPEAPGIC